MQAARGTSIGPAATVGPRRRSVLIFVLVAITAYAIDQVTKVVAVAELDGRPNVEVVGDLLQLNLVRNPGAAFSIGTSLTPLLSALAVVAALTVLWFSRRLGSTLWAVGLGLLLAGVLGNLTDRVLRAPGAFRGHVIDFLQLPNWPIFNVADICINAAAGLIILQAFRGIRLDGTHEGDEADEANEADDADPHEQEAPVNSEADPDKEPE